MPNSFEAWLIYMKCMFTLKDIKAGLIAIDSAPLFKDLNLISVPSLKPNYDISEPFANYSTDVHTYFMLPTFKILDYRSNDFQLKVSVFDYNSTGRMPACYIQDLTQKDVNCIKTLLESSKHGLLGSENEMKCYDELVSVEKEINLAVLFKIK
jgi:hypothetical protein